MGDNIQNSISTNELCKQYNWFAKTFPEKIQNAWNDFFESSIDVKFIGLSKNINCLVQNEACFVTKKKINKEYDVIIKLNTNGTNVLLTAALGECKGKFNLNKLTELETKIINTFNSSVFETIKDNLNAPDPIQLKRTNFDIINLTFYVKNKLSENNTTGKFVLTLPQDLVKPEEIISNNEKFSHADFLTSETLIDAMICKTKFKLPELMNLEIEDIVVFENSNINKIQIKTNNGNILDCNIKPNFNIEIESDENDDEQGENVMAKSENIWDIIEVDMIAEFDSIKISLGDLKNIEDGLVVDLAPLYDNLITLKIEGKPIAKGSLVIVNDRYGVKISEVMNTSSAPAQIGNSENINNETNNDLQPENEPSENSETQENFNEETPPQEENSGEDFDYSDFDLEDENI